MTDFKKCSYRGYRVTVRWEGGRSVFVEVFAPTGERIDYYPTLFPNAGLRRARRIVDRKIRNRDRFNTWAASVDCDADA